MGLDRRASARWGEMPPRRPAQTSAQFRSSLPPIFHSLSLLTIPTPNNEHLADPPPRLLGSPVVDDSGSGSVDFQEFVGGLSAFSSKGGRDEKLKCKLGPILSLQSGPASIISDMKGEEQS